MNPALRTGDPGSPLCCLIFLEGKHSETVPFYLSFGCSISKIRKLGSTLVCYSFLALQLCNKNPWNYEIICISLKSDFAGFCTFNSSLGDWPKILGPTWQTEELLQDYPVATPTAHTKSTRLALRINEQLSKGTKGTCNQPAA